MSISCQEDYEEAFENVSSILRLDVMETTTKAKFNMPMNLVNSGEKININFGFSSNTNDSVIFEEIKS